MPDPWRATWTFTTASGVASGSAGGQLFPHVRKAVLYAAWLSREEDGSPGTELDPMTALLVGLLHSEAREIADEDGTWRFKSPDGWADVLIRFNPSTGAQTPTHGR